MAFLTHPAFRLTLLTVLLILTAYLYHLNTSLDAALSAKLSSSSSPASTTSHHVKLLDTIPRHVIPTPQNDRRLIVVGDIHGMSGPLDELLEKVAFDPDRDHLVATGDMISKGPDSKGVVDKLIALNASAVRGNHEDHVLKARAKMDRRRHKKKKDKKKHHRRDTFFSLFSNAADPDSDDETLPEWVEEDWTQQDDHELDLEDGEVEPQRAKARDRKTARSLKKHHVAWLRSLPIILSLEPVLPIYIVHGGLVPGLQVRKQDPWAVMNMRTLRYPKHKALELDRDDQQLQLSEADLQHPLLPSKDPLHPSEDTDDEGAVEATRGDKTPIPTDGRRGQRWADAWNKYQRHLPSKKRRAVIYGHDAKRGHRVGEYTFGLDSGCVTGGKLTAVVVKGGGGDGDFTHEAVQISC